MNLSEFLLARIAEDEATANDVVGYDIDASLVTLAHTERWSPARVFAECEAKRAIVEEHDRQWKQPTIGRPVQERYMGKGRLNGLWTALQHLALPYADHPDYRDEWRP